MAKRTTVTPWHEVVQLREDLKTGELSLAVFAADLYDVIMQKGRRPVYEDPARFFALTYPTLNLRELVKEVCLRLTGRTDRAHRKLSVNYGGGKTHTLIALWHLVHDPAKLPNLPAIDEFEAHVGFKPPQARVAALCFDKIDLEKGVESIAPDGSARMLRHPWSVLAFQLAGPDGLRLIHANGEDNERATPPADPLLADLLRRPQKEGLATLVLLDEVLMYLRGLAAIDRSATLHMVNFFQYLTQAVVQVDRCAMVTSLLASEPSKYDELGRELLRDVSEVFGRQREEDVSPVSKDDVSEVLRRRFFQPESISNRDAFRPHVAMAVGNIADLDDQTRRTRQSAEERFLDSYPFHPDLTDLFYTRWTQLDGFQRTRGILRTFAMALRDAEQWDTSPLVGPNVFLHREGGDQLSDAAGELATCVSIDDVIGNHQEWQPILQGELDKACRIQTESAGLRHRELEQAVVSVFLSSQPVGQKALTRELNVLVGATRPDRIELEKALQRWTDVSWFLDEVEVGNAPTNPDGTRQLPGAWRLGDRPNLRQMHDDACANRVQAAQVEAQLLAQIGRQSALTAGASAAGARVHNLPERPSDIRDDGDFHYAVLGPSAASESGKPSSEAKRFINETTGPDRPRANRNAIVLAPPSRDGLDLARNRIRDFLGWREVQEMLKGQAVDSIREQRLRTETEAARNRIPDAIRQAYSIVVTVNEAGDIHAFKIAVGDEHLFVTIKSDSRARIQETAISADAMLPDGPYDLWHEGEESRPVSYLVGAFAQVPKLPKMLQQSKVRDTVAQGVLDGIWVARLRRPDGTAKTFWRTEVDDETMRDPYMEVVLPEAAALIDIEPTLLGPPAEGHHHLPELWVNDEITVQNVIDYFAGGRSVSVPKEDYDDIAIIPRCEPATVNETIQEAVRRGVLWLTNGPASILGEPVPPGVLSSAATLKPPPSPIPPQELTKVHIPNAWQDGSANALAIITALSNQRGETLPWSTVRNAIDVGLQTRWFERDPGSGPWPCDLNGAQRVIIKMPATGGGPDGPGPDEPPRTVFTAEATMEIHGIQDLAERVHDIAMAAVGNDLRFNVRIEMGGENTPEQSAVDAVNAILAEIVEDLKLN